MPGDDKVTIREQSSPGICQLDQRPPSFGDGGDGFSGCPGSARNRNTTPID